VQRSDHYWLVYWLVRGLLLSRYLGRGCGEKSVAGSGEGITRRRSCCEESSGTKQRELKAKEEIGISTIRSLGWSTASIPFGLARLRRR
jgi:hypothetical protein